MSNKRWVDKQMVVHTENYQPKKRTRKRKKQQAKMESLLLSHVGKPQLTTNVTAVSAFPRSGILNQSVWSFPASTSQVISLLRPAWIPLRKDILAWNNPLFEFLSPALFLLMKTFLLVQLIWPLPGARGEAAQIRESLNKARDLHIHWVGFSHWTLPSNNMEGTNETHNIGESQKH